MSRSTSFTGCVAILVLLATGTGSVSAQQNPLRLTPPDPSGGGASCVAGKFLGGFAGALVGGIVGVQVERAFYPDVPDAGLTGLSLGIIVGAIGGSMLAGKRCGDDDGTAPRRTLPTYSTLSPSLVDPPRTVDTCFGATTRDSVTKWDTGPNERRLAFVRPLCIPGG